MYRKSGSASFLAAVLLLVAARADAYGPTVAGSMEVMFDSAADRCATWDIADTPARAWRGRDGQARLLAGSTESRVSIGESLDRLRRDCRVVFRGAGSDDPGDYDDRVWVHATFTSDGQHVIALGHAEYHGHLRRDLCLAGYMACWRNAIVELVSNDGGLTFQRKGLAAALPYRYSGTEGRRTGYFNPSNIVLWNGYLYAFVMAEEWKAQRRGPCLIRRLPESGPQDWRAWDGAGFTVRFSDPYREVVNDPAAHVCAPVGGLTSTISSVVRHGGRFVAVMPATRAVTGGRRRSGVYWSSSDDLVTWTTPTLLWEAPLLWRRDCAQPAVYAYPSLLDEDSPSRNLDLVDDTFWLYVARMPLDAHCKVGPARDLVRMRVNWHGQ